MFKNRAGLANTIIQSFEQYGFRLYYRWILQFSQKCYSKNSCENRKVEKKLNWSGLYFILVRENSRGNKIFFSSFTRTKNYHILQSDFHYKSSAVAVTKYYVRSTLMPLNHSWRRCIIILRVNTRSTQLRYVLWLVKFVLEYELMEFYHGGTQVQGWSSYIPAWFPIARIQFKNVFHIQHLNNLI